MYPVLFSVGPLPVSSFGFFLILALISAIFVVWRIARSYDLDEEKIFDLSILTFFGGLIGARLAFVLQNPSLVSSLESALMINRYPGLSFWGGLVGGIFVFWLLTKKFHLNFWQLADIAVVGLILALGIGDIGCFLGGCSVGKVSDSILATPVVGVIGKRFPLAFMESLAFLIIFPYFRKEALKFHFTGKLAVLFIIILGLVKIVSESQRADLKPLPFINLSPNEVMAVSAILLGIFCFYKCSKRKIISDLINFFQLFYSGKKQKNLLLTLRKSCYNLSVSVKVNLDQARVSLISLPKVIRKRLNVKLTPPNHS